jgi:hypothetical protein
MPRCCSATSDRRGGALWAATTLIVKATALIKAPAEKGLGYQVAMSIPILALAAWISGETITHIPAAVAVADGLSGVLGGRIDVPVVVCAGENLFGQQIVGLHLHHAAVRRGRRYFIMHDTLTLAFGVAALLVIAGLYLVNRSAHLCP